MDVLIAQSALLPDPALMLNVCPFLAFTATASDQCRKDVMPHALVGTQAVCLTLCKGATITPTAFALMSLAFVFAELVRCPCRYHLLNP